MDNEYSKLKVIIVDDMSFMRTAIIKILLDLGFAEHNLYECENGKIALDLLRDSEPNMFDIILSDWNMPKLNGLECLKAVRRLSSSHNSIPYVLITTVSERNKVVEAINYKVSAYLLKPVEANKLKECFSDIFSIEE